MKPVQVIEQQIKRMLASKEPQVVCLSGFWGVGKTYTWNKYLLEAKNNPNGISMEGYSYVSLFGVNSLEEMKSTIFFNAVGKSQIGIEPTLESFKSNIGNVLSRMGKTLAPALGFMTGGKLTANALGPLGYLALRETVVCIDDIERRGDKLSARNVLGLVATLRDQKKCSVIIILNDDAMAEDSEKEDFENYFEKVVDVNLRFDPTADDCAAIALKLDTHLGKLLATHIITLGISNIRVIKKIERFCFGLEVILRKYDRQVFDYAVKRLVLVGWGILEPKKAPPIEYLRDKAPARYYAAASNTFGDAKQGPTEDEKRINSILDRYEFTMLNEFDLVMIESIRNGYFDEEKVSEEGRKLNDRFLADDTGNTFRDAWDRFHNSFEENQEEVLDGVYSSFVKSVAYLTPYDLNGTVWLFKNLGRIKQAAELLSLYIDARKNDRQLFDLRTSSFNRYVDEPDVRNAFINQYESFVGQRSAEDIMRSASVHSNATSEDIDIMSKLSVDEFYRIFKNTSGTNLSKMILCCLNFGDISNSTYEMEEVFKRAKEALVRIGRESAINALRLKRYGIKIED